MVLAPLLLVADRVLPDDGGEWAAVLVLGVVFTGLSTLAYAAVPAAHHRPGGGHPDLPRAGRRGAAAGLLLDEPVEPATLAGGALVLLAGLAVVALDRPDATAETATPPVPAGSCNRPPGAPPRPPPGRSDAAVVRRHAAVVRTRKPRCLERRRVASSRRRFWNVPPDSGPPASPPACSQGVRRRAATPSWNAAAISARGPAAVEVRDDGRDQRRAVADRPRVRRRPARARELLELDRRPGPRT